MSMAVLRYRSAIYVITILFLGKCGKRDLIVGTTSSAPSGVLEKLSHCSRRCLLRNRTKRHKLLMSPFRFSLHLPFRTCLLIPPLNFSRFSFPLSHLSNDHTSFSMGFLLHCELVDGTLYRSMKRVFVIAIN